MGFRVAKRRLRAWKCDRLPGRQTWPAAKQHKINRIGNGGRGRTRTYEGIASGFTVRPLCRSGHSPLARKATGPSSDRRLMGKPAPLVNPLSHRAMPPKAWRRPATVRHVLVKALDQAGVAGLGPPDSCRSRSTPIDLRHEDRLCEPRDGWARHLPAPQ